MRLVADLRHEHQRGRVATQPHLVAPVGEDEFLQAHLAPLALLDAHDHRQVQPELAEDLARHRDLAAATIDEHEIRQPGTRRGALLHRLGEPGVAPLQHLAHGGVVVARRHALDVEAPILRRLHRVGFIHDAGGLGGFARGVAHVEALDAQALEVGGVQVEHLGQCARALALRTLLGQQPRQRQLGTGGGHLEPGPALLARLVHGAHAHA